MEAVLQIVVEEDMDVIINYNKSKVLCQLCGRNGHVALKCYSRFDVHFTGNDHSRPISSHHAYITNQTTSGSSSAKARAWYVDSGDTNHVTHDITCRLALLILELKV